VQDDGDGFSVRDFEHLMKTGIGNSEKPRLGQLRYARPTIGRLGIGMLGLAQICGSFTITSRMRDGNAFRAELHLYDLLKEKIDQDTHVIRADGDIKEVLVGTYDLFKNVDPEGLRVGTRIATSDLHPTFVRAFQQSLSSPAFREPPTDWLKAVKFFSTVRSLQELGDYWRLVWETSAACPIPYISDASVPKHLVVTDQARLESFNFQVILDNLQLRKPVYLRGNAGGYTTQQITPQSFSVYGKKLEFHGYIVVQEGRQLNPDELRGILVRIKDVGIGYYDPSMLDYRFNQGPRSRWLTGEIFVTQGLEDALNIDRDSFNRFHPQFRVLQEYVHGVLTNDIFPRVYKQIDVRSAARADKVAGGRSSQLATALQAASTKPVSIRRLTGHSSQEGFPSASERSGRVEVLLPRGEGLAVRKPLKDLATAILAIFEVASQERTHLRRRDAFRRSLLKLLEKW
jgi:hypothetical protein